MKKYERICVFCESFEFDVGESGYSEDTPSWDARIGCWKKHWKMIEGEGAAEYRKNILKASKCPDWKKVT